MKLYPVEFYIKTKSILVECGIENKIPLLSILIFVSSVLEIFGIGMIIPITAVFLDAEILYINEFLEKFFGNNINKEQLIFILFGFYFFLFIIKNIFLTYIEYFKTKFIHKVHFDLISYFYSQYIQSPITFFLSKNKNYLTALLSARLPNYSGTLIAFSSLLSELILSFILVIMLLILMPITASAIAIILLLIILIYVRFFKNLLKKFGETRDKHESYWIKNFNETLNFLKEIRIFDVKEYFSKISDLNAKKNIDAKMWITFINSIGKIFFETVAVIFLIFFLFLSFSKSGSFEEFLPFIAAYIAAAVKFLPSINRIANSMQYIAFNLPTTNSILNELVEVKSNFQKKDEKIDQNKNLIFKKSIILKDIDFSYPDGTKIFEKFNLEINKGETIGIVGDSGLGKSTLIEIMCGFLKPQNGTIIIDDQAFEKVLDQWKYLIGYVPQETFILNDTIKNNVGIFDIKNNQIKEEKVIECLKLAGLDSYLRKLSKGINTFLPEGGKSLSGGQKQRISIARNLYKNSKIIFFDEPTSSLDDEAENKFLFQLEKLKKTSTLIIVTHKKKVANFCDKIIDLSKTNVSR